jgi:hypothetical protein
MRMRRIASLQESNRVLVGDVLGGEMARFVVRDEPHPPLAVNANGADATVVDIHFRPCIDINIDGAADEIAQNVPMTDQ